MALLPILISFGIQTLIFAYFTIKLITAKFITVL